jgi:hypothetical protein
MPAAATAFRGRHFGISDKGDRQMTNERTGKPPRQAAKPAARQPAKPAPPKKSGPPPRPFRLPHGAEFHASYDAEARRWTVTLAVPGLDPTEAVVKGVHQGFSELGRRWLEEHGTPAATDAA